MEITPTRIQLAARMRETGSSDGPTNCQTQVLANRMDAALSSNHRPRFPTKILVFFKNEKTRKMKTLPWTQICSCLAHCTPHRSIELRDRIGLSKQHHSNR